MTNLPKNSEKHGSAKEYQYESKLSRRDSLKWLGALSATLVLPPLVGCSSNKINTQIAADSVQGHWPQLNLAPITAKGYGKDPNLIMPVRDSWPRTLLADQLNLVAVLSDIIVPKDGNFPSATDVNVPDVVDEWISAPYSRQQNDRIAFLSALQWIDDESVLRFNRKFVLLSAEQQLAIIDDIAYSKEQLAVEFSQIVPVFSSFRKLVLSAYFSSPEGTKDLGYLGNVPIAGDYPGPSDDAMAHLQKKLVELGL